MTCLRQVIGCKPHRFPLRILVFSAAFWLAATLAGIVAHAEDVIDDVNNVLINIIQNTSASLIDGPPEVANEIALIDGAMFDAVNVSTGLTYAPFRYTAGAVPGADANAAALQAAITVMDNLYVNPATSLYQQFKGLTGATYFSDAILAAHPQYANDIVGPTLSQIQAVVADVDSVQTELDAIPVDTAVAKGIAIGTKTGNATIIANDASGSQAAMVATLTPFVPTNEGQPGVYVPPVARPALQPTWGSVAPLGLSSASLTAVKQSVPGPQPLTSPGYAEQVMQTECQGSGTALPTNIEATCTAAGFPPESAEEAQAALFWNDPGGTLQPPGHWLQIADIVTGEENLGLLQTARATSLAAIAMNDAGIATWAIKYQDNAWRPVTAIEDCSDWNPSFMTCDPNWAPLIATPPHPDYLAGHPAFSGAAATTLVAALGTNDITFTSTSNAYCNFGSSIVNSLGNIIGCVNKGVTFLISTASCANGGVPQLDSDGDVIGCMLDGVAQSVTGGDCNNAGSVSVLNPDASANPLYNGSPLICPIAQTFGNILQASDGFLGAEFSRVVGGIHTPDAVEDAEMLGDEVGSIVASTNLVSEPPITPVLGAALLVLGGLRLRRAGSAVNGIWAFFRFSTLGTDPGPNLNGVAVRGADLPRSISTRPTCRTST
jgi:hypothetical protein